MNTFLKKLLSLSIVAVMGIASMSSFAGLKGSHPERSSGEATYSVGKNLVTIYTTKDDGHVKFSYGSKDEIYAKNEMAFLTDKIFNVANKYKVKKKGIEKVVYNKRYMIIIDEEGPKYFLDNTYSRSKAMYDYVLKNKKYTYCSTNGLEHHKVKLYKVKDVTKAIWENTKIFEQRDILTAYNWADYWADFLYPEYDFDGHVDIPLLKGESVYNLHVTQNGKVGFNDAYVTHATNTVADMDMIKKYKPKAGMLIIVQ